MTKPDPIPDPMPFVETPGDMGEFELVQVATTASGEPVYTRRQISPATYTGGKNVNGAWTLARPWKDRP